MKYTCISHQYCDYEPKHSIRVTEYVIIRRNRSQHVTTHHNPSQPAKTGQNRPQLLLAYRFCGRTSRKDGAQMLHKNVDPELNEAAEQLKLLFGPLDMSKLTLEQIPAMRAALNEAIAALGTGDSAVDADIDVQERTSQGLTVRPIFGSRSSAQPPSLTYCPASTTSTVAA